MRVFLDHAATTPLSPEARAESLKWMDCGNPSSLYFEGRRARAAIDQAREEVSTRLGAEFGEIIFTGSGTEAASLAIVGSALSAQAGRKKKVLISEAEHHCAIKTSDLLQALGFEVVFCPVDQYARLDLEWLERALSAEDVLLVAAMHVNNELGTIEEVFSIAELCHRFGSLYFCDAVQSFGKIRFRIEDLGADLVSVSAHKIYGPKGVGALYVKAGTPLKPVINGGGQERELRAGTENVAAIAGFAAAVRHLEDSNPQPVHGSSLRYLKGSLFERLSALGAVLTTRSDIPQVDSHLHLRFPGTLAESILIALDREGVSVGSGAACSSGSLEPSHVLRACGYSAQESKEGIRITFGRSSTAQEVEYAAAAFEKVLGRVGAVKGIGA